MPISETLKPSNTDSSANVDDDEVQKFNDMANRWWDLNGDFKPLHKMNPIRANYIDRRALVAQKLVLDVGCGGGILTEALAQRGAHASGIDLAENALEVARLHALESQLDITYSKISAEDHASNNVDQYDVITCLEMLEHVPDPQSIIQACATMLKPGGDLFLSTLNRNPKSYAMAIIGAEYILNWLPKGTHDYQKFIKPSELSALCRQANLEVLDISGIAYNPLTQDFCIKQHDTDVNYLLHARSKK